ncbi:hypothetical protein T484DRAFT_1894033 [Baffinella frigidus]|nr:hypothetical protein T484DRAFT_1894033 [Cryptophyta sp. CCMP2293]
MVRSAPWAARALSFLLPITLVLQLPADPATSAPPQPRPPGAVQGAASNGGAAMMQRLRASGGVPNAHAGTHAQSAPNARAGAPFSWKGGGTSAPPQGPPRSNLPSSQKRTANGKRKGPKGPLPGGGKAKGKSPAAGLGKKAGGKVIGKRPFDDKAKRNGNTPAPRPVIRRGTGVGSSGAGGGAVGRGGFARVGGRGRVGGRDPVTGRGRKKRIKMELPKGWQMCRTLGEPVADALLFSLKALAAS